MFASLKSTITLLNPGPSLRGGGQRGDASGRQGPGTTLPRKVGQIKEKL